MADVERLCAPELAGRGAYQPGGMAAAALVEREFRSAGLEVVRQAVGGGAYSVIGIKRASEEAVLVSAHYDHLGIDDNGVMYPGADDNASGVAVMLAMARAASQDTFAHTVIFVAFGAEELGLIGSGAYVRDPTWPLNRTRAVINFDMVGRNFFEAGANQAKAAAVVGLKEVPGATQVALSAGSAAGLKLITAPPRLLELFGFDDRTDDWWFRRHKVPSIHFSTGLHSDYHQPTDTPDKLVPGQLVRVGRTAYELLRFVAAYDSE